MNIASIDALQKLAAQAHPPASDNSSVSKPNGKGIDPYGKAALEGELAKVEAAPVGERNNTLNTSAFALGQLVGGGVLSELEVTSELERTALATGLEPSEARATIQSELRAGMREPRNAPKAAFSRNGNGSGSLVDAGTNGVKSAKSAKRSAEWPDPPGDAAFAGLAGEFVGLSEQYTEADPVALLASFLTAFGCAVGRGPHTMVGATRHDARLFTALVGKSSKARKGDSWMPSRATFDKADPVFTSTRIQGGIASGEGLIHVVRDPMRDGDPGIEDKRLLVIEPEFARLFDVMGRQGNTLNPLLREAWDRGNLQTVTKNSPMKATDAHICILAHVTLEELRRKLSDTDIANGFANRFIFLAVKRAKELPEPELFEGQQVDRLADALQSHIERARQVACMRRDPQARELWKSIYHDLSDEREGLVGSLTARSEA